MVVVVGIGCQVEVIKMVEIMVSAIFALGFREGFGR